MLNNEQLCVVGLVISSRQSAHCSAVVYSAVAGKGGQRPCAGGFEGVTVESFHSPACAQPGQVEFHKKGWPGRREGGG